MKSNFYIHEEYINPREHLKGFWGRIAINILAISLVSFILIKLFKIIADGEISMLYVVMIVAVVFVVPLFWLIAYSIKTIRSPIDGFKFMGKVIFNNEGIMIITGNNIIKKLKWKDISIIEKSRKDGEKIITLITNSLNEKYVVCSDKKQNYIIIPGRVSLENALKRFSKMEITIADSSMNRFTNI